MIIGITGTRGAGKGTIVDFLKRHGFVHLSVEEFLMEELAMRGMEPSKENMIMFENSLRQKFGASFVVDELYNRAKSSGKNCVIESVRCVGEVNSLRAKRDFILFAVDADVQKRFERITGLGVSTDHSSFEDFISVEMKEMNSSELFSQNLVGCIRMADYHFENNGSIEELYEKVRRILKTLLKGDYREEEIKVEIVPEKKKEICVRPTWDEYFFGINEAVGKRSICEQGNKGCVVVNDKQILVSGYSGFPVGVSSENANEKNCLCAEQNAICQAARRGISLNGATLYVSTTPCFDCAKVIINSGIKKVVCKKMFSTNFESADLFKKAGLELVFAEVK